MKNDIYKSHSNYRMTLKRNLLGGPKRNNDNCCNFREKLEEEGLKSNFVYITNFNWRTKSQKSKLPYRKNCRNKK